MLAPLGPVNQITSTIIKAAIEVHRQLGAGLLEAVYQSCLQFELKTEGLRFVAGKTLPVIYKGVAIDGDYRLDFFVEEKVIVEVNAVAQLLPVHDAQLLTYLKLTRYEVGLLLNFNVPVMKEGGRRILNRGALGERAPKQRMPVNLRFPVPPS
jgi:GxxExxY protein